MRLAAYSGGNPNTGAPHVYKHILVPTDGSSTATRALEEAIKLAKAQGAEIRLLHVVNELRSISPGAWGLTLDYVVDGLRNEGRAILAAAAEAVRAGGVAVDTHLIEVMGGAAGEQIVRDAHDWPADLIVCGTHGRRGIARLLMGSDAEYVVRHTAVPVLMVRPPAE